MSPEKTEINDREFELLHNFLDNYKHAHYTTAHCWGQESFPIYGNMYVFNLEVSNGPNYHWISITVYLTQDEIPTCIFSVKKCYGKAYPSDDHLFVYKPRKSDDWKKVLTNRIIMFILFIFGDIPIVHSHGFARVINAQIPVDLSDAQPLTLNLQAKKDNNPVPHASKKENLDKVFIFSKV